ncbi:MAG: hypothetical protein IAF94_01665 [Pirellulaceae bacterium]|nr:hypothetical protein [Pirellulaceae bacterium]
MNSLELHVMEFALQGEHPALEVMREQFAAATVPRREYTGVGIFTHFAIPDSVRRLPSTGRIVVGDVYAEVPDLQCPVGFLVFFDRGILSMLECYTCCVETWPEEAFNLRLYYVHPKELGSPSLVEIEQRDLVFALGSPNSDP